MRLFILGSPESVDWEHLGKTGLQREWLLANSDSGLALQSGSPTRVAFQDDDERRVVEAFGARAWPYTREFFKHGGMLAIDPMSGARLLSSASYSIDDQHIAYEFQGTHPFYLFVGRWRGEKSSLVIPARGETFIFPFFMRSPQRIEEASKLWDLLRHHQQRRAAISRQQGLGVQVGFLASLGHYVWQELAGIDDVLRRHGPAAIASIVVGGHAAIDPLLIFPELASARHVSLPGPVGDYDAIFDVALSAGCQLMRPVGARISRSLVDRIVRAATQATPADFRLRVEQVARERRLLWINLRAHNKVWTRQVDGYVALVRSLADRFGDLGVVLDGYRDVEPIAREISNRLPQGVHVIDTLGCSIHESIVWANAIRAYCSVVGSGLVINSWLARKPGVAHANPAHLAQESFWSASCEGCIPPKFVPKELVSGEDKAYTDYDFDERWAVEQLAVDLA